MVTAVEGIARLSYAGLDRVIKHVLTIEPRDSFEQVSGPGDSGSIWLEENSLSAIGLHFAGSDSPERALAMDLQPVLEALRVDLIRAPGLRPAITTTRQAERVAVPK